MSIAYGGSASDADLDGEVIPTSKHEENCAK